MLRQNPTMFMYIFPPLWDFVMVEMCRKALMKVDDDDGEATSHLWQRLGVLLQRGNPCLFNNRIPSHPEPQVDGLL